MDPINMKAALYQGMIGVGGIGSGLFFALNGNHTLGREESRGGRILDQRDYCKLHIISHYVKALLGPDFETMLVGKVGDDSAGKQLLVEMDETGLDCRYVEVAPGLQTLFSICFVYPDGDGGNMTIEDSANSSVDAAYVTRAEPEFARLRGRGVALAAPEVPLVARKQLLQLGTDYDFFRVLALTTAEIKSPLIEDMLLQTDLLAINQDEAAALAGMPAAPGRQLDVVEAALTRLRSINPDISVSFTAGKRGSWIWDGKSLAHQPAFPAQVVNTAGAGDAHLAGLIVALVAGLGLLQAHELGAIVAALSVTSPHTINPEINRASLCAFSTSMKTSPSEAVRNLLSTNQ